MVMCGFQELGNGAAFLGFVRGFLQRGAIRAGAGDDHGEMNPVTANPSATFSRVTAASV